MLIVSAEFPAQEREGIRLAILGRAQRGLHGRLKVRGPQPDSGQFVTERKPRSLPSLLAAWSDIGGLCETRPLKISGLIFSNGNSSRS